MKNLTLHKNFEATLNIYNDGKGYVVDEADNKTYYIKRNFLKGALNGDKVKITVSNSNYSLYPHATLTKIIKRGSNNLVAKIYKKNNKLLASLYPLQSKQIIIKENNTTYENGDIVNIKITNWRENHKSAYAKVVKLIAKSNHPDSDYLFLAKKYGVNDSKKWNAENYDIKKYKMIYKKNLKNRIDLCHLNTFTIDPKNAKDYDDAISIQSHNGMMVLYIHIADVSVYVEENGSIDKSAQVIANSYYFDEKTTHMLPEYLAKNLCSLMPKKRRLSLTNKIVFDSNLNVLRYDFIKAVIKSDIQFTYEEVENIIDGKKRNKYQEKIKLLNHLAINLKQKRLAKDGLDLNLNEIIFEFDMNRNIKNCIHKKRFKSNVIVEECMLLANKLASKKIDLITKQSNYFGIFRNHDIPSYKSEKFLKDLICSFKKENSITQSNLKAKHINKFLCGLPLNEKKIFSSIILRKMKKAHYSTKILGHYGLGFENYTHFTSPIRRYADIIAHRIIKGNFNNESKIFEIIKNCNEGEMKNRNFEQDYYKMKKLKFLKSKINESLKGYIIKIQKTRIIISEKLTGIDGVIMKNYLSNSQNNFDISMPKSNNPFGLGGFQIGQIVNIKVDEIDLVSQTVFFKNI